jgi:hypothetical protein
MSWTWRDVVATALVAVIALTYVTYLSVGGVVGIDEVAEVAVVGLVGGWASRVIGGRKGFVSPRRKHVAVPGGFVSLGLGIATLVTGSGVLLAVFVASIIALWALAQVDRLDASHRRSPPLSEATA